VKKYFILDTDVKYNEFVNFADDWKQPEECGLFRKSLGAADETDCEHYKPQLAERHELQLPPDIFAAENSAVQGSVGNFRSVRGTLD
jgi:hypothetical protein